MKLGPIGKNLDLWFVPKLPRPRLAALLSERQLYERASDPVRLTLLELAPSQSRVGLELLRDGQPFRQLEFGLDEFGMATLTVSDLPVGEYLARVEKGGPERAFQVVEQLPRELCLAVVEIARLTEGLEFALLLTQDGRPFHGQAHCFLVGGNRLIYQQESAEFREGRLRVRVEGLAEEPLSLLVRLPGQRHCLAGAPLLAERGPDWPSMSLSTLAPSLSADSRPGRSRLVRGLNLSESSSYAPLEWKSGQLRLLEGEKPGVGYVVDAYGDGRPSRFEVPPGEGVKVQQPALGWLWAGILRYGFLWQGAALIYPQPTWNPEIWFQEGLVRLRGGPARGQAYVLVKDYRIAAGPNSEQQMAQQLHRYVEACWSILWASPPLPWPRVLWDVLTGAALSWLGSAPATPVPVYPSSENPTTEQEVIGSGFCWPSAVRGGVLFSGIVPLMDGSAQLEISAPPGCYRLEATVFGEGHWSYAQNWCQVGPLDPEFSGSRLLDFRITEVERHWTRLGKSDQGQLLLEGLLRRFPPPLQLDSRHQSLEVSHGDSRLMLEGLGLLCRLLHEVGLNLTQSGLRRWEFEGQVYALAALVTDQGIRVTLRPVAADYKPPCEPEFQYAESGPDRPYWRQPEGEFEVPVLEPGLLLVPGEHLWSLTQKLPLHKGLAFGCRCALARPSKAFPLSVLEEQACGWLVVDCAQAGELPLWKMLSQKHLVLLLYADELEKVTLEADLSISGGPGSTTS